MHKPELFVIVSTAAAALHAKYSISSPRQLPDCSEEIIESVLIVDEF